MAEVVSPSDLAEELHDKLSEYFAAGVKIVWVIYPTYRLVYVYESLRSVHIDGGSILPGFRIPIASLFPKIDGPLNRLRLV